MRGGGARIVRVLVALVAVLAVAAPTPAPAHQDWDHPGVDGAITSAVRHPDGHVTASGWAECPLGQDWGVGFHIFEDPNNPTRETGMASLSAPVEKVVCDGQPHSWTASSESIYGGGISTDGEKLWSVKMQSPTEGDWIHKDKRPQGAVQIGAGGGGPDAADVSVTKTDAPDPVAVGSSLTYHLAISNAGPATAAGVTVTDPLPSGVTFNRATPSQGTCSRQNNTVTCSLGSVGPGAGAAVDIVVTPSAAGVLTNTASVSSSVADPDPTDNIATAQTIVGPVGLPPANLSVTKSDLPDPTVLGAPLVYVLSVANAGPATARSVVVTDVLPGEVVYLLAIPTKGACSHSGGVVSCVLGDLAPSGTATVHLLVAVTQDGTLTNTASVGSTAPDPVPSNNQDTEQTTVLP